MLAGAESAHHTGDNALFYLSVPPATFSPVARQLHNASLFDTGDYKNFYFGFKKIEEGNEDTHITVLRKHFGYPFEHNGY